MGYSTGEVLDQYYRALQSADIENLRRVVDAGIVVTYHDSSRILPWGGVWTGFEGFVDFLTRVSENLCIDSVEPLNTYIDGAAAVVEVQGSWVARTTGRRIDAVVVNIFTVADNKISRYTVFPDTAAFAWGIGCIDGQQAIGA